MTSHTPTPSTPIARTTAPTTDPTTPAPWSPLTPLLQRLEGARALDALVRVGDRVSGAVTATPAVRDALQGRWLGHAVHPVVVQLPIGTWTSATVLDLAGGPEQRVGATLLTGVGIAAAVPAAVTGWAEYQHAGPRGRRVSVVHAVANATGLGLQVASLAARRGGRPRTGAALGAGALGVVGLAGYLGGHVAAARKVSSHDPAFGPEPPAA